MRRRSRACSSASGSGRSGSIGWFLHRSGNCIGALAGVRTAPAFGRAGGELWQFAGAARMGVARAW
jgi:hypothetical protein